MDRRLHPVVGHASAQRALHRFAEASLVVVAVPPGIDVVDQREVDTAEAEALQAVVERAQHAVVAVVVERLEREAVVGRRPTVRQANTLAVDPRSGRVLLASRSEGTLELVDP